MEHAAAVAQLRAHGQLGFGAFGRAMEDIHAEEPGECGYIGERHCRSSAAVDVLIACTNGIARLCISAHPISLTSNKYRLDGDFLIAWDCRGSHLTAAKGEHI